ncbi:DUF859 family phage minor structural protein [Streptococcus uberis]|uniref:DUF859 family phage minor structural protein n=1 Tax=Streptococcus uberis TaxID=1349 RepID=UPI000620286B|nr:DUF859 family phage minor structural protein [Streptococcus uberis]KKF45912.1 hypothetical protein AF59_00585 [Streptococcus uberis C5072]QBX31198.1 membrane protein [Streptococcus phage Javan626]
MGTSTFSGDWGHNLTLEIFSAWNSQNIAGNYSTLNVQVFLSASSYAMISTAETRPLTMTINGGSEIVQVNPSINYGQRKALLQKDYRINHNSDGTKPQFNISAKFDINISYYGSATATQAIKLPDIKRASTSDDIAGNVGSAVTINISKQMSTFRHTLKFDFKGLTGTIASLVDTSYAWTIPNSFATMLPNSLSGTGTLIVETYTNTSEKVGENRYTITATIPDTATYKPTLASVSLSDANTATGSLITGTNFVRILSRPKVTFGTATGKNGSTIKSYNAEVVGKNKFITGNGSNFDMLDFTGSAVIRATVTDSRGLTSAPVDTTINVLDYFLPQVVSAKITRAQSDPNIFQLSPIVEIAPLTVGGIQKNQLKIKVEVAPYDTGVYTVDNGPATNTWSTISKMNGELLNLGGSYDKAKSWLVRVTVSDSLNTAMPIGQTVSSEFALMVKAPTGVSFGKIWERGIIDAQGDVYVSGKTDTKSLTVDGFAISKLTILNMIYPVGSIFISTSSANPATTMGGTWTRYGQGRVLVGVNESDTDFSTAGKTGGEKTHLQTVDEMPSHTHGFRGGGENNYVRVEPSSTYGYSGNSDKTTNATGGNKPFNIMQPYITTYMWLRTA